MAERIYDNTSISMFQECRKKYYWRMIRHLEPVTVSSALTFGGCIHEALDIYYTKGIDEAIAEFGETYKDREGDEKRTVENGVKLLKWYAKVYANEPFKVLAKPEMGFVIPLTDDILYGGRMDLPVEWDGQLWVMEHKTASGLTPNWFRQWTLDKQATGYIIGTETYFGRKCAGCIINALEVWKDVKRVTAKTKKPEDHFCRFPMTRSTMLKERFVLNIQRIVRDIRWCEENDEFMEAESKNICFSYNSNCPYLDLCLYGEDEKLVESEL